MPHTFTWANASRVLTAALLLAVTPNCAAQFRLTDLSGRIITGVYRTRAEDLGGRTISFVPLTFDLQTAGYFSHPDFLSFDVKPILTNGPQATEAGFIGGNGVAATATFLRRRAFPVKVFYNNLRREDVFYGGLTQVSGYRCKPRPELRRQLGLATRPLAAGFSGLEAGQSDFAARAILSA